MKPITEQPLKDALSERYLAYALSTITARSLPDLRDGMKPVHRRIIYAMQELRLNPDSGFKKCARIVGDVMGKYHPHGDGAIYDAMVRMAQEFSLRYALVDGQGNFGNIDGDNAAAMRYTEARMTNFGKRMLLDIGRGTVDFRGTYDGEGEEPEVLPSAFPNLLANGAQGIAVGMATNIPPHNIHELCDALLMLLDDRNLPIISLLRVIKGPDFPTGGVLIENREETLKAYSTGKGAFRLRAHWQVEQVKGGSYRIVIDEIPFQVQKSKLIEKIAELMQARKLPLLSDIRDESAEDIRIVLYPKSRVVEPHHIMASLFKQTDLETRFNVNMNVLDEGQPKIMPLNQILLKWLEHRRDVMVRAKKYRLEEIEARLHILAAYLVAYRNLDMVIKIIRENDDAKKALVTQLKISEHYAEIILAMRLRQLQKLEEGLIIKENQTLQQEQRAINLLLGSQAKQDEALKQEVSTLKLECNDPRDARLTRLENISNEQEIIPDEVFIEREPLTVIYSQKDWVKTAKTHLPHDHPHRFKEGDDLRFSLHCQSTDNILIFTSLGKSYLLPANKITAARGFGEPLRLLFDIDADDKIIAFERYDKDKKWLLANNYGQGFVIHADKLNAQTRNGRQVMVLKNAAGKKPCLVTHFIALAPEYQKIAVIGTERKLLIYTLDEIPELARGQGVILQKYKDGYLADIQLFSDEIGLTYQKGGRAKKLDDADFWLGKRGQVGKLPPLGFPHRASFGG